MNQELYNQSHNTYVSINQALHDLKEDISDIVGRISQLKVERDNYIQYQKATLKDTIDFSISDPYIKHLVISNSIYAKEYFEKKIEMIESEIYFYTQQQIKYLSEFYQNINHLIY